MTEQITDSSALSLRIKVAGPDEITEGRSKIFNIEGRPVAVFRIGSQYFAIGGQCLHRGGPLGEGEVRNFEVTCPWHGWRFNLSDGSFSMIPTLKVKTFKVSVDRDGVYVEP